MGVLRVRPAGPCSCAIPYHFFFLVFFFSSTMEFMNEDIFEATEASLGFTVALQDNDLAKMKSIYEQFKGPDFLQDLLRCMHRVFTDNYLTRAICSGSLEMVKFLVEEVGLDTIHVRDEVRPNVFFISIFLFHYFFLL